MLAESGHLAAVAGFVNRARSRLCDRGGRWSADLDGVADHGYYLPTVVTDVTADMEIWRDEVFGPVVVVFEVDGLDEAIMAANDSQYGLSAAVYSSRLDTAERFADEVDCGQIAVNTSTSGWDVHFPFSGFRRSGSLFKEQGDEAIGFCSKVKTVAIHVPASSGGGS